MYERIANIAEALAASAAADWMNPLTDRYVSISEWMAITWPHTIPGSGQRTFETTLFGRLARVMVTVEIFQRLEPNDSVRPDDDDAGTGGASRDVVREVGGTNGVGVGPVEVPVPPGNGTNEGMAP